MDDANCICSQIRCRKTIWSNEGFTQASTVCVYVRVMFSIILHVRLALNATDKQLHHLEVNKLTRNVVIYAEKQFDKAL